jgi:ketosteroid isomerase-like protein
MSDFADHALAIANLKAAYCRAADTAAGDPDAARALFANVFTDDFIGDYGYEPMRGPGAITEFLCTAIAGGSAWMIHMLHSPRIVIDGDEATGDWSVMVQSRRTSGEDMTIYGRYSDRFRLTPQGWRIAHIAFWRPT